jgi:hypothetical protein
MVRHSSQQRRGGRSHWPHSSIAPNQSHTHDPRRIPSLSIIIIITIISTRQNESCTSSTSRAKAKATASDRILYELLFYGPEFSKFKFKSKFQTRDAGRGRRRRRSGITRGWYWWY